MTIINKTAKLHRRRSNKASLLLAFAATVVLTCTASVVARAQSTQIDGTNWGSVTAPVYGTAEKGAYSTAELFAGPNKFGTYFSGVLPNGRMVKPAGTSAQVGMNPLGLAISSDGKFLVTSNDDERESGFASLQDSGNTGGYSLSVVDTSLMKVVSSINTGRFFVGLQITGTGPYTVWASGGSDNDVKLYNVSSSGAITTATPARIAINPILPPTAGYVSNYVPGTVMNTADSNGNKPPVPSGFNATAGAQITFPAGSALSPNGNFLYVACNGDNSVAVIDTTSMTVVRQVPVGFFPYGVSVSPRGDKVVVSNWGVTEYKFANPTYDSDGKLIAVGTTGSNLPVGFFVPPTSTSGPNPQTSSVSILVAPAGNGSNLTTSGAVYEGSPLDSLNRIGGSHPSAMAVVTRGSLEVLYVAKTNSDSLGMIVLNNNRKLPDFDLSPVSVANLSGVTVHGAYPNALAVSPDKTRLYVAEAGINSVAVLDTTNPIQPKLLGRIATGWYPTGVAISADGRYLYIENAKGIGEDINPNTDTLHGTPPPTGIESLGSAWDGNFIFGTVQQVDLRSLSLDNKTVLANNFASNTPSDTSVVPAGGVASSKIKHVFFILHENKTVDSMLGNQSNLGPFASTTFNDKDGKAYADKQFTGVALNTQKIASKFATAVNYYSDSEESDAGHQFAASGTASDYTEKTLLVKTGRGLLVNKNFEPEDYPESGYIFNNAARHNVSFKDYGALVRVEGTDTGTSSPTVLNDPTSGNLGFPTLQADNTTVNSPIVSSGDVDSETQGLGQSYFMNLPILAILGTVNNNGEPRLDSYYPGYNFNISDQRRAQEFNSDFDGMVAAGTLPQFIYIYQPNDHMGGVQAPNSSAVIQPGNPTGTKVTGTSGVQEVADGDVGLGMVINHIMQSPVYYDPATGTGSAIFVTWDDAQSTIDHIHEHRTPLLVVSPFAKPGYLATKHYSTASIVKTEELILGLPPNNLGDLFATDLRDMFQPTYNGIAAKDVPVTRSTYKPSIPAQRVWRLVSQLDTSGPDRDSARIGALARLSSRADDLFKEASAKHRLRSSSYKKAQEKVYQAALKVVNTAAPVDLD